ncbi:MAG: hypothetical protein JWR26_4440 [Pedosphaera sp.]|nr:hypothetical protein [Pedosphaera sp.]
MKKSNDLDAMNPDDFEPELQRRPIRPVPAAWRAEILAQAHEAAAATNSVPRAMQQSFSWRELFWPVPQAWAALAAIWIVILAVNYSTADKSEFITQKEPPPSPEMRLALREQARMMAKLIEPFDQPADEPPKPSNLRPRSESQRISMV